MQDHLELQKLLLEDLEYKDGEIFWKKRGPARVLGKKVGSVNKHGYVTMFYKLKTMTVHRAIFLMHHGYLPKHVDHIDGNKKNNRIENLRAATPAQNRANSKIPTTNKSGFKGVCWLKNKKKFWAYCRVDGKQYDLGTFKELQDAIKVVREFRDKHLGEFVRHE
jgi:hypothetical protein